MVTIDRVAGMQAAADACRRDGRRIGFVPTMGALHDGHRSLFAIARGRCDVLVVSVFVNPAQFGPGEDYESYPRDPDGDAEAVGRSGADVLFLPGAGEMYPPRHATAVDPGPAADVLEGRSRPGHFRGVATVVAKLFNIVKPHVAVFGRKDAQQLRIVRRLAEDLHYGIEIVEGPTLREADGLAMSSRNARLGPDERRQAPVLRRAVQEAMRAAEAGERDGGRLRDLMRRTVAEAPAATLDYVSVADPATLAELDQLRSGSSALFSLAVRFGSTRLIDNDTAAVP